MGNDGGSVPKGSDLRKQKKAEKKADLTEVNRTRWLTCALSKNALSSPIVADAIGNIFNKESIIKALIEKSMPKHLDHIRSIKDVFEIRFHPNSAYKNDARPDKAGEDFNSPFDCPITGRLVDGKNAFSVLKTCGHIFSEKGLRETESSSVSTMRCFTCAVPFTTGDVLPLNPSPEFAEEEREKLKAAQKAEREAKKRSHDATKTDNGDKSEEPKQKKHKCTPFHFRPRRFCDEPVPSNPIPSLSPPLASDSSTASTSSKSAAPASLAVRVALQKAEGAIEERKVSDAYKSIFSSNSGKTEIPNLTGVYMK